MNMSNVSADTKVRSKSQSHRVWQFAGAAFLLVAGSLLLATVEAAPAATPPPSGKSSLFLWSPFLAPFHAVVLHYPIGFLTMAFLMELYALKRPSDELRRITTGVIGLSLLTGLISAGLGILRAGSGDYSGKSLDYHRIFGIAIPFLTVLTLVLQMRSTHAVSRAGSLLFYRASLMVTLVALVIAGHYGGNLTHGSQYLVQNAPEFIKELLSEEPAATAAAEPGAASGGAVKDPASQLYLTKIKPIFEAKCISCHGPEKQKGKYRLDKEDFALKAGSSGEVGIKPKEPLQSKLVSLILLPHDHEDAMPPDGKEALTSEEIIQIVHWVQNGASFGAGSSSAPMASLQSVSNSIAGPAH